MPIWSTQKISVCFLEISLKYSKNFYSIILNISTIFAKFLQYVFTGNFFGNLSINLHKYFCFFKILTNNFKISQDSYNISLKFSSISSQIFRNLSKNFQKPHLNVCTEEGPLSQFIQYLVFYGKKGYVMPW